MRALFAVLGLLLFLIATRADELPMIKDSEAVQYVGKNVEVRGLVISVTTSPLGTECIRFEREYPDQRFAGLIARSHESLTLVARKTIPLLIAALSLILTASHSHAGLGWTLGQFEQQYGKPVINQEQIGGRIGYAFRGKDYIIAAFFLNRQVSRIIYICRSGSVFSWGTARALLSANAPEGIWGDPFKSDTDNSYRVNGTKDDVETYYASLTDDGTMLVIWTKEDEEATRTTPKLDTPPLSSVMVANEKSTGEITAGQAPTRLTPEINQPTCRRTQLLGLCHSGKVLHIRPIQKSSM
jgi:hypothetical protein